MESVSHRDTPVIQSDDRLWAMMCHLSALLGYAFPFGNLIGPLAIWIIKRKEIPLVEAEGKKALNFQLSMTIYIFVAWLLCLILIGLLILLIIFITNFFLIIIAGVATYNRTDYQYPFSIKFLK